MTPAQCRAARGLINMSLSDLAAGAVVSPAVVWDLEAGFGAPSEANLNALQGVFERAGVEFIEGGVRVRKGSPA
jgi:transcriptional regulator with XRE-family HTH domain